MAVLDLIDLTQAKPQYFSVPKPLINFLFENSTFIVSKKLIESCKTFKLLHLKNGESQLDILDIYNGKCKLGAGVFEDEKTNDDFHRYKINTAAKSLKIMSCLNLYSYYISEYYVSTLMPKLDLSQTKTIYINVKTELKRESLENLLNPSLETLRLTCRPFKDVNPALLAFQKCPKITMIEIMLNGPISVPFFTKDSLKKMSITIKITALAN